MVRPVSNANDKISPVIEECTEGEVTRQLRQHEKNLCRSKMAKGKFQKALFDNKKRKMSTFDKKYDITSLSFRLF